MSDANERLLDVALEEHYGHGPAPDLPERILDDSGIGDRWSEIGSADRRFPISDHRPRSRGLLRFAGLVGAAALIGWAIFAPMERLPAGVSAKDAEYTVREGAIEARSGWYLLSAGAPALQAGGTRLEGVTGRVLVRAGEIPDEAELAAARQWLAKHNLEEEMKTASWIKAGAVALCLLAGGVTVGGSELSAQAMERKRVQELERELENAREELKEAEEEARRQAEEPQAQSGDRIKAINGKPVRNMDEARRILRDGYNAGVTRFEVTIERDGETHTRTFNVPRRDAAEEDTPDKPAEHDAQHHGGSAAECVQREFNELEAQASQRMTVELRIATLNAELSSRRADMVALEREIANARGSRSAARGATPEETKRYEEIADKRATALESQKSEVASEILRLEAAIAKLRRVYADGAKSQDPERSKLHELDMQIAALQAEAEEIRAQVLKDPLNGELGRRYKEATDRAVALVKQRQELAERLVLAGDEAEARQSRYLNNAFNELGLETLAKLLPQGAVRIVEANHDENALDSTAELRRLIAEKEHELAELRRDAERNAARAKEVERSIEALRAGLKALEDEGAAEDASTTYTVKEGDSWWKLAYVTFKERGLSTRDLQQANPGVDLRPGMTLKIPAAR